MPTQQNEFKAYFTVVGDFEPAEITAFVGMEATESWKKGDVNPVNRHERRFSRWSVYSRLDKFQSIEDQVRDVVEQLKPYAAKIAELADKYDSNMQTVAYFHRDKPWLSFDQDVIAGCAALWA